MKVAKIAPESSGVHFLFIIADAGYRKNEEERMTKLLKNFDKLAL